MPTAAASAFACATANDGRPDKLRLARGHDLNDRELFKDQLHIG